MTAQLSLLTAETTRRCCLSLTHHAPHKPSHSRSTSLLTAGASQPSSLWSPCHRRLDTRWPRSEGGCCLSLIHHAPHKLSHSRSISAKQFVIPMPPALRHLQALIRGWLLFIFDPPRTSQVFSQQEPQLPKSSHSRSTQSCQLSCRLSATGTLTSTVKIRECLFDHSPLQFYTILHRFTARI